MNKKQFILFFLEYISNKDDFSRKNSSRQKKKYANLAVDTFFNRILNSLVIGDRAEIRGFGVFHVKEYKNYVIKNPKTLARETISSKKMPTFKMSSIIKKKLIELSSKK